MSLPLKSVAVYKFTCSVNPNQSYVGKTNTGRHQGQLMNVKEHNTKASAMFDHRLNCQSTCATDKYRGWFLPKHKRSNQHKTFTTKFEYELERQGKLLRLLDSDSI